MRIVLFCHSLLSDWNHGNAHFLRGIVGELLARGHRVTVYEPTDAWSVENLVRSEGPDALYAACAVYPWLAPVRYPRSGLDLDEALSKADLVLVHEWTDPEIVASIGAMKRRGASFIALFHDTHHRMVTDPASMQRYDLSGFDGVLAFGSTLAERYAQKAGVRQAWVWHEAADIRVFYPRPRAPHDDGDVIFIGNWGDEERTRELFEFLIEPVAALGLRGSVYGVRYPVEAISALERAGLAYRGWAPNFLVPDLFAQHRVTIHIPRRPYAAALPGIPTIRPFEAMACRIPLVSAPWDDTEHLFRTGKDYLVAQDGSQVVHHLESILHDGSMANQVAAHGRETILTRHTCAHRVDVLLAIYDEILSRAAASTVSTKECASP